MNEGEEEMTKQAQRCLTCEFKLLCGGECEIEWVNRNNQVNSSLCLFHQHLILLAFYLSEQIRHYSYSLHLELLSFAENKYHRQKQDPRLAYYLAKHPHLSFTEVKKKMDEEDPVY